MKKVLMLLLAGTLVSGMAAYYAGAQMARIERTPDKGSH